MIDTATIKKHRLRYWVDRSQAARKAAEELAMKEVKPSLRDLHKNDVNEDLVFILGGHKVEFKDENEVKTNGDIYFTYEEAMERFGEPDEDGWRLPTKEELEALRDNFTYVSDKVSKQGVFDKRLYLPLAGYRDCLGIVYRVGSYGSCWSSTPYDSDYALYLNFFLGEVNMYSILQCFGLPVRLIRDVK